MGALAVITLRSKLLNGSAEAASRGVYRICENPEIPRAARHNQALLLRQDRPVVDGFPVVLTLFETNDTEHSFQLPESFDYLREGDVVKINPAQKSIQVVYRKNAPTNSLFVTERCNHYCVMCSQPPREIDDSYLVEELLEAIPLMDQETKSIGITGGEPTLAGDGFVRLLRSLKNNLPSTSLHVLSNGRNFTNLALCKSIAEQKHRDLMFGIPIYSSIPEIHNFVVQSENAWDETIKGIINLRSYGVQVEIRVVLHSQTVDGLVDLAQFIIRNLTMVNHVAFMGLEKMGFGISNWDYLFVNPRDYAEKLGAAVLALHRARVPVSVYNIPLCMLPKRLHEFARQSISDWKNDFPQECGPCVKKQSCAGFFTSTVEHYAPLVIPFLE